MGDLLARYEDWVLSAGTQPTVTLMLAIFSLLSLVTLVGYRAWTRSLRAWFWFGLTNVGIWSYFVWADQMNRDNRDHMRVVLIHAAVVTGVWFGVALARRIIWGRDGEWDGKNRRGDMPGRRATDAR